MPKIHRPAPSEAAFLQQRDPAFHTHPEVIAAVDHLRSDGEVISDRPVDKIGAHLGYLASKEYGNDGFITGDPDRIAEQVMDHVVQPEDVPENYWEMHRRILEDAGHGRLNFPDEGKAAHIKAIQEDQADSLAGWAEYVTAEATGYPTWFRRFTMMNVVKLADFDDNTGSFKRRRPGTMAVFPDLNEEALSYVYDEVLGHHVEGKADGDALVESANFAKLYARAVKQVTPATPEQLKVTTGSWTKYDQIQGDYQGEYTTDENGEFVDKNIAAVSDPTARAVSRSLRGKGTRWCTAGIRTAATQLQHGDFYVFNSTDQEGNDTIPRVAIRMENGLVAEVSGLESKQQLEPVMLDIAKDKLAVLEGGEAYLKKVEDMRRLTEIMALVNSDRDVVLSESDTRFVYEMDRSIEGFGHGIDPRIDKLRRMRDFTKDFAELYDATPDDINTWAQRMAADNGSRTLKRYLQWPEFQERDDIDWNGLFHVMFDADQMGGNFMADRKVLKNFHGLDKVAFDKILSLPASDIILCGSLGSFEPGTFDINEVIPALNEKDWESAVNVLSNLEGLKGINAASYAIMFSGRYSNPSRDVYKHILQHLDAFEDGVVDVQGIAESLAESDNVGVFYYALKKHPNIAIDETRVVDIIIKKAEAELDEEEPGYIEGLGMIAMHADRYSPDELDHRRLRELLIATGGIGDLYESIDKVSSDLSDEEREALRSKLKAHDDVQLMLADSVEGYDMGEDTYMD